MRFSYLSAYYGATFAKYISSGGAQMKHTKFYFTLAFLAFAAISSSAEAGCGDSKAQCYFYKGGKLVKKGACTITECSNMSNYLARWNWKNGEETDIDMQGEEMKVNGKPGFDLEKGKLSCFGINTRKDELYCTNHSLGS